MLTPDQEKWLAQLSDTKTVSYFPFDSAVLSVYDDVAARARAAVGEGAVVELRGSAALGIGGQREIDVYLPVPPVRFDETVAALRRAFGDPGSLYPLERARFAWHEAEVKVELFVINEEGDGWRNGLLFEGHLATHPDDLARYELLKKEADGVSLREYYRRKLEFLNEILARAASLGV